MFLGKKEANPKIHSRIKIENWELPGQNPHCKDLALNNAIAHVNWASFFGTMRLGPYCISRVQTVLGGRLL